MAFNSENFIIFLTAFLLSYYIASNRFKKWIIFLYSIAFYIIGTIGSFYSITIFIISIILNYIFALILNKSTENKRILIKIFVFFDVLSLIIFKLKVAGLVLPLGYSFIVFHYISFLCDLSNNKISELNLFPYLNYILFFPKLISGPITRYNEFIVSHDNDYHTNDDFFTGLFIFSCGLGLKCLLSDNILYITNQIEVFGYVSISIITAWIGVYAYYFKLYFDFAGYSLMAIGIAKICGYTLPTNFNMPHLSKSISEFWRRWHITLGAFFRDYVYIPLGGNRCGKLRMIFNLFVVWLLTGFWHGTTSNYIIWACILFLLIVFEKLIYKVTNKKPGIIIVIIIMPLTFLIFQITELPELYTYFTRLIDIKSFGNSADLEVIINNYLKIIVITIIFATKLPKIIYEKIISKNLKILMIIISIILIISSLYMLSIGESDTFRYFTF